MTTRGERIAERMSDLRLSMRAFEAEIGVNRRTIQRAIEDDPAVRETSYQLIERGLDDLEGNRHEPEPEPEPEPEDRLDITITISINGADLRRILGRE